MENYLILQGRKNQSMQLQLKMVSAKSHLTMYLQLHVNNRLIEYLCIFLIMMRFCRVRWLD